MVLVGPLLRGEIIGDSRRFVHDPRITIASVSDPAFCNKRRKRNGKKIRLFFLLLLSFQDCKGVDSFIAKFREKARLPEAR